MLKRIAIYLCLAFILVGKATGQHYLFDKVEGLSNVAVSDIYQDETGLMWFATRYGLNSYDGNAVTAHYPGGLDFSIPRVSRIVGDGNGHIFLQANQALLEFDLKNETFRTIIDWNVSTISKGRKCLWICVKNCVFRYDFASEQLSQFAVIENPTSSSFYCITEDSRGYCWVGSSVGVHRIGPDHKVEFVYPGFYARAIFEDSAGDLWFGSHNRGLIRLTGQDTQTTYRSTGDAQSLINDNVRSICEDGQGRMWIGTPFGLCILDPRTGLFERLQPEEEQFRSSSSHAVTSLYKDGQGTIWISTFYGGVSYVNSQAQRFRHYPQSKDGLPYPVIGKFAEQDNGRIWIGTEGGRLLWFDPSTSRFGRYQVGRFPNIKEMFYDRDRECLWLGFIDNGLDKFDLKTKKLTGYDHNIKNLKIVPYEKGFLIGSSQNLFRFDPARPGLSPVPFLNSNEKPSVLSLLCDSRDRIWIGTNRGLMVYEEAERRLKRYNNSGRDPRSISGDVITSISEDARGDIWLVSMGGGVNRYLPACDGFERYTSQTHGLQDNSVTAMAVTPSGNILLGTTRGLSILDPADGSVRNYNRGNGFPLTTVNEGALFVSSCGDIYVGGVAGMVVFREQDLLREDVRPGRIWFSQLLVNNQPIGISHREGILTENLRFSDRIRLRYDYSIFSIRLATDNYVRSGNASVEYRLRNYSDRWMTLQDQQMITYTNLPSGSYELEVRVKEYPQVCDSLAIRIVPPVYGAWYAYCIYILLAAGGIWWLYRNSRTRFYLKTSLEFEKREKENARELAQNKLIFFTNISHELNTPLTMIIAQVDTLLRSYSLPAAVKNKMVSIYKNTGDLKKLIAELIEFRRQDTHELQLTVSENNLGQFLDALHSSFSEFAIDNRIGFTYVPPDNTGLHLWFDPANLHKAVGNVLSNAFKFTKPGGTVSMETVEGKDSVTIIVRDTGIGLEPGSAQRIFEQFYQSGDSSRYGGFGIGLAFSKKIVDSHGGEIRAGNRQDGPGAVFEIELPKGDAHFCANVLRTESEGIVSEYTHITADGEHDNHEGGGKQARLLIVEDNRELVSLLASAFGAIYRVDVAYDAETGIEKIRNAAPDLVVSDVMLPQMSGTELCSVIKNNLETCHIPVVLLTARSADQHKIEGLQVGADDYITKPFDMHLLLVRCNNLLNNRKLLQRKYLSESDATPHVLAVSGMDLDFINRATQIAMDNIDNDDLSIDVFAREMGMSRTLLFNKMKGIIGVTPNKFILNLKLKKAADMLLNEQDLTISEIAYRLGFNSPKYFAVCFRNMFAYTPTEFRERNANRYDSD